MARRYDSRTTTFSPEGRLYQVEYAMEAINLAGSTVGVLAEDGVVLAGEKKTTSKLLDQAKQHEKLFQIDSYMCCAVAGITSDANILLNKLRLSAAQHVYTYGESMPVEQLVTSICDLKQGYTQFGGLRPFGVSFLVGGYDAAHGFQLYHTDPSGNFSGWKAYAIGVNNNTAQQIMRQDWKPGLKVQEALELTAKVLVKTMDTASPNAEKLEFCVVEKTPEGKVQFRMLKDHEVNKLMADAAPKEEDAPPS
jgi:20S proteasome subunit alpha 3